MKTQPIFQQLQDLQSDFANTFAQVEASNSKLESELKHCADGVTFCANCIHGCTLDHYDDTVTELVAMLEKLANVAAVECGHNDETVMQARELIARVRGR